MSFLEDLLNRPPVLTGLMSGGEEPQENDNLQAALGAENSGAPKQQLQKSWTDHLKDPATIAMLTQFLVSGANRPDGFGGTMGAIGDALGAGGRVQAGVDARDKEAKELELEQQQAAQDQANTERRLAQGDRQLDLAAQRARTSALRRTGSSTKKDKPVSGADIKREMDAIKAYNEQFEGDGLSVQAQPDKMIPILTPTAMQRKLQLEKLALKNGMPQEIWDGLQLYTPLSRDTWNLSLELARAYSQGKEVGDAYLQELSQGPASNEVTVGVNELENPAPTSTTGAVPPDIVPPAGPRGATAVQTSSASETRVANKQKDLAVKELEAKFRKEGFVSMEDYERVMAITGAPLSDLTLIVEGK